MSYIGPITQDILDTCIGELKKKDSIDKISKFILNPLYKEIKNKFYLHYMFIAALQIMIIILLFYIIIKINKL